MKKDFKWDENTVAEFLGTLQNEKGEKLIIDPARLVSAYEDVKTTPPGIDSFIDSDREEHVRTTSENYYDWARKNLSKGWAVNSVMLPYTNWVIGNRVLLQSGHSGTIIEFLYKNDEWVAVISSQTVTEEFPVLELRSLEPIAYGPVNGNKHSPLLIGQRLKAVNLKTWEVEDMVVPSGLKELPTTHSFYYDLTAVEMFLYHKKPVYSEAEMDEQRRKIPKKSRGKN